MSLLRAWPLESLVRGVWPVPGLLGALGETRKPGPVLVVALSSHAHSQCGPYRDSVNGDGRSPCGGPGPMPAFCIWPYCS